MTLREVLEYEEVDIDALLARLTRYVPTPASCKNALVETRAYFEFCTPSVDADKLLDIVASYVECDCEVILALIGEEE